MLSGVIAFILSILGLGLVLNGSIEFKYLKKLLIKAKLLTSATTKNEVAKELSHLFVKNIKWKNVPRGFEAFSLYFYERLVPAT